MDQCWIKDAPIKMKVMINESLCPYVNQHIESPPSIYSLILWVCNVVYYIQATATTTSYNPFV